MRPYRDRQRTLEQLQRHLEVWAEELSAWEVRRRYPIAGWSAQAPDGSPHPIAIGDAWDNRIGIHRFRTYSTVTAPEGADIELRLDFGGEALVKLIDAQGNRIVGFGANPHHPRFAPVPRQPFFIEAEVAARSLFGIPQRNPALTRAEI